MTKGVTAAFPMKRELKGACQVKKIAAAAGGNSSIPYEEGTESKFLRGLRERLVTG